MSCAIHRSIVAATSILFVSRRPEVEDDADSPGDCMYIVERSLPMRRRDAAWE